MINIIIAIKMPVNHELTHKLRQVSRRLFHSDAPPGAKFWEVTPTKRKGKKWQAVIEFYNGKRKIIPFGASGMEDFTQHHDEDRRARFHSRFRTLINEKKTDITSPMFYSYHLLW